MVIWAGPIVGVLLPLALVIVFKVKVGRVVFAYLVPFFAGFCLFANGAYIGVGSFGGIGDAGEMLRHGSPICCRWLFGVGAIPLGLYLWNGLGPHFGIGSPTAVFPSPNVGS